MGAGLPCLPVDDIPTAVAHYERFLGFETIGHAGDGRAAIVRRDGASILLRERDASDPSRLGEERRLHAWDAVLTASDLDAAFEDLSVRGVSVRSPVMPHPFLGRTFSINDRYGNVLSFVQAPLGPVAAARRRVGQFQARRRSARFFREAVADLQPHLDAFRAFYEQLDNKRDIFYMFFTGGLMHWAVKAASFVPPEVNLVLLGSNLSEAEREWLAKNLPRPLHHIDVHTNDWAVWDFLFDVNRYSFGWLDIDCLVLNGDVFDDLTVLPADASVNCLWSYDSGFDFRVANTYMVFVNAEAIRDLRGRGIPVWARPHDWHGGDRSAQAGKRCFYRIPTRREARTMLQVVPPDDKGRPRPPGSHAFFDTLSIYQILARSIGYRTNQVRDLDNPMLGPVEPGELPAPQPQGMSDELIHVGGISYYHAHFREPATRVRYLAADYVTLAALAPHLPPEYGDQLHSVGEELRSFGVEPESAADALRDFLQHVGGLSPAGAERALSVPGWA
jgi:hypothetical protein